MEFLLSRRSGEPSGSARGRSRLDFMGSLLYTLFFRVQPRLLQRNVVRYEEGGRKEVVSEGQLPEQMAATIGALAALRTGPRRAGGERRRAPRGSVTAKR